MSSAGVHDFSADQASRWHPLLRVWTDASKTELVDLTGFGARLTVVRAGFGEEPVLELTEAVAIALGGVGGTIEWDVSAVVMAELVEPLYNYDLFLVPGGDEALAKRYMTGRVLIGLKAVA